MKYVYDNELVNYKITIFVLVRTEIKFLYKIINNCYSIIITVL